MVSAGIWNHELLSIWKFHTGPVIEVYVALDGTCDNPRTSLVPFVENIHEPQQLGNFAGKSGKGV